MPEGTFRGTYAGRSYIVSRTVLADGKAWSLVGDELGGSDRISLNLYRTARRAHLRPCEMPRDKVVAFVLGLSPDPTS